MGMRIGNSGAASQTQGSGVASWQARQQSFQQLTSALQSGDIGAAQQAFSGLSSGTGSKGTGPLAQLGQALQAGDLSGAQQALQTIQANRGRHHHHRDSASTAGAGPVASSSSASQPAVGSLINATA